MNPRNLASGLLLATGVAHAAEWALRSHATPMLVFGAIYFSLGAWLRRTAGRPAVIASIAVPALGGLGGAQQLLAAPELDVVLAGMVAVDAGVVVCGALCLAQRAASKVPAS